VWEKVGGFAELYSPGCFEDVELTCRIRHELGLQIVYNPKAVAYHHVGASAQAGGIGFPLARNRAIFLDRMGKYLTWNEWAFWG
jgi:GT2 family glycosyltransferase